MKRFLSTILALGAGYAGVAMGSAELAEQKQCDSCHTLAKETIGPSYRAIADRYAAEPQAFDMLVAKVKSGGWGHWGDVMMPPKTARVPLSDDEATQLVKWVLDQK